jgi:chitinase
VARSSPEYNIACYFSSWAWLRGGDASFIPENVPVDSCTHLLYAYVGLDPNELVLQRNDRWTDFDNSNFQKLHATSFLGNIRLWLNIL